MLKKIELKNIVFAEAFSTDSLAYVGEVYVNDVLAATAINRGDSFQTQLHALNAKGELLLTLARKWCYKLSPIEQQNNIGLPPRRLTPSLQNYLDTLALKQLNLQEEQRHQQRVNSAMHKGIVVGVPYTPIVTLHFMARLEEVLMRPVGYTHVQNTIADQVLPVLKDGKMILNTNIPLQLLKDAGLNENQYVKPEAIFNEQLMVKPARKITKKI